MKSGRKGSETKKSRVFRDRQIYGGMAEWFKAAVLKTAG